jgi:hypothetical protein
VRPLAADQGPSRPGPPDNRCSSGQSCPVRASARTAKHPGLQKPDERRCRACPDAAATRWHDRPTLTPQL